MAHDWCLAVKEQMVNSGCTKADGNVNSLDLDAPAHVNAPGVVEVPTYCPIGEVLLYVPWYPFPLRSCHADMLVPPV